MPLLRGAWRLRYFTRSMRQTRLSKTFFTSTLAVFTLSAVLSVVSTASAMTCDGAFRSTKAQGAESGSFVYVLKFDAGAGFLRLARGRIDTAEYDLKGVPVRYEIFHDRGRGVYSAADVFLPMEPRWVNVPGRMGYSPVLLLAGTRGGLSFVGRDERGELQVYNRDQHIFPIYSSHR